MYTTVAEKQLDKRGRGDIIYADCALRSFSEVGMKSSRICLEARSSNLEAVRDCVCSKVLDALALSKSNGSNAPEWAQVQRSFLPERAKREGG